MTRPQIRTATPGGARVSWPKGQEPTATDRFTFERAVIGCADLSRASLLVAMVLAHHFNRDSGQACVGQETLARECRYADKKSIKAAVEELEELGFVTRKIGGEYGVGDATTYQASLPFGHPALEKADKPADPAAVADAVMGPGAVLVEMLGEEVAARFAAEAAKKPAPAAALNRAVQDKLDLGWTLTQLRTVIGTLPEEMLSVAGLLRHRLNKVRRAPETVPDETTATQTLEVEVSAASLAAALEGPADDSYPDDDQGQEYADGYGQPQAALRMVTPDQTTPAGYPAPAPMAAPAPTMAQATPAAPAAAGPSEAALARRNRAMTAFDLMPDPLADLFTTP